MRATRRGPGRPGEGEGGALPDAAALGGALSSGPGSRLAASPSRPPPHPELRVAEKVWPLRERPALTGRGSRRPRGARSAALPPARTRHPFPDALLSLSWPWLCQTSWSVAGEGGGALVPASAEPGAWGQPRCRPFPCPWTPLQPLCSGSLQGRPSKASFAPAHQWGEPRT